MKKQPLKQTPLWFMCAMLISLISLPVWVSAQALAVDPAAMNLLQRMTEQLGKLKQFSVHTQVTLEDVLESGHRIDQDVSASVIIARPNKVRAVRKGDPIDQTFYYNGQTLTLFNPKDKVYATKNAPKTIEGMLDYARESLGLTIPAADLIYGNAFELLSKDVNFAVVLGKTAINGVRCVHLLFSRPGVDFQVWISDDDKILPYKYVVTDRANTGWLSVSTVMSDWRFNTLEKDTAFTFVAPDDARAIDFMPVNTSLK